MTPEREALEAKVERLRKSYFADMPTMRSFALEIIEALSAAPGEPCAVKPLEWIDEPNREPEYPAWNASNPFGLNYRIFKVWWGARDKWAFIYGSCFHHTIDEAKAAAQADYEKRIRSALVTTPQPAAGWDWLSIEHRPLKTGTYLVGHRGHQEIMKFFGPDVHWLPGTQMGWLRLTKYGWRHDDPVERFKATHCIMIQAPGDRREAPAPAERVKQQSDEVFDIEETRRENADNVRTLDAIAEFVGCPHDEELTVNHVRAHYAARPDTAEARLREHCIRICLEEAAEWDSDDVQTLKNYAGHCANRIAEETALSPPSGGDEAKESEGVPGKQSASGAAAAPIETEDAEVAIRPSEPSSPADRRKIVALADRIERAFKINSGELTFTHMDAGYLSIVRAFYPPDVRRIVEALRRAALAQSEK